MTTVVSAYFKIPSKKSHSFYVDYLKRWFRSITCPVVFFTSQDVKEEIENFGYNLSHIHFQIMNVADWNAWKLGRDFWERQRQRDVEKYHTPELAAIWYEKKEFVKRAFELSDAQVFVWCDAGCVRDDSCEKEMQHFGKRLFLNDDKIHVQYIREQPYKQFYVYPEYRFAGAIIAGNRKAWLELNTLYDNTVHEYDNAGISCNMDQYVMASCYDRNKELFALHKPHNSIIDVWFFFLCLI